MIQIINKKGFTAHLYPDTSISIERNNPLFLDNENYFEDITYSFNMPADAWNKEFFKSGHLVEAANSVYELDVQTFVSGTSFFAGLLSYSFKGGDFEAILKINYGALVSLSKNTIVNNITTLDGRGRKEGDITTPALMKASCQNPQDYPFAFFPVHNPKALNGKINNWNHETQNFEINSPLRSFYKLEYILQKILEYLGFELSGTFFENKENRAIYIYGGTSGVFIESSLYFIPEDITITDFFKMVKQRLNISISFNILEKKAYIDSAKTMIADSRLVELGDFVTKIDEIARPNIIGYTLSLKPDDTDELYKTKINDEKQPAPTNQVIIGDGEKPIEIDISTLKEKEVDNYVIPTTDQPVTGYNKIRFLRFYGMKYVGSGKVFPEARAMEISSDDIFYYQFLNDSKKIKLTALISVLMASNLTSAQKISFNSKEGFLVYAITEKISYQIKNKNESFILVDIECRTISFDSTTTVKIQPVIPKFNQVVGFASFRAYFSKLLVSQIEYDLYYENWASRAWPPGQSGPDDVMPQKAEGPRTVSGVIPISTDAYGVGGIVAITPFIESYSLAPIELRIKNAVPKYIVVFGKAYYFKQRDNYYYLSDHDFDVFGFDDQRGRGLLIVF
ncbi:hypothetical protein [Pedobacter sp. Leaf250]|uniref:hypothetical protein n=1 Tax=Pedobacter sp. Leaf250 TaxID=2876559 RepID=UPI001E5AFF67|nr:hypothetical protein [Pedobacter sp. Leaf250]